MPGTSENAMSQVLPPSRFGNGRSHPPSHSVVAIALTDIMLAYSARKKSDQRKPLYSVRNPATSSLSASGRSKGARLVSATIAMAKTPRAVSPTGKNENANQVRCCNWACTIPIMLRVPVPVAMLVIITADTTVMLIAIS